MFGSWDIEHLSCIFKMDPGDLEKKFFFTDSKEEFLDHLTEIATNGFKQNNDNLRYLELLEKIQRVRDGADVGDVYPWAKKKTNG